MVLAFVELTSGMLIAALIASLVGGGYKMTTGHKAKMRELDLEEKALKMQGQAGVQTGELTERMATANREAAMLARREDIQAQRSMRQDVASETRMDRETQMLTEMLRMAMMPNMPTGRPDVPASITSLLNRQ